MPGAAIEAGAVDFVLPLNDIAPALEELTGVTRHDRPETLEPEFDALLDYLRRTRGFDFSAYKRRA